MFFCITVLMADAFSDGNYAHFFCISVEGNGCPEDEFKGEQKAEGSLH